MEGIVIREMSSGAMAHFEYGAVGAHYRWEPFFFAGDDPGRLKFRHGMETFVRVW